MVKKKKTETSCDFCNNLVYDDEIDTKDSIAIINYVLQLIDLDDLGPAR